MSAPSEHWQLLQADSVEATLFVDLEATRAHIVGAAAPPNRCRQVYELRAAGRTYYLKEFRHTQWKNRWRSRLTRPRAGLDGDRERAVADALGQRGIRVARPVAFGRSGRASFYLCAQLDGDSLRELLATGRLDRQTAFAAARFGGAILFAGVHLPDLSADHIFAGGHGSEHAGKHTGEHGGRFAVIDLHNGTETRIRRIRPMVRILRRFRKSVRGLSPPRSGALGFACRLMKAAGYDTARRRRVIERVPPMDTHGRYEVPGRAAAYRRRSHQRTTRELAMLERIWPGRPGDLVLDSPAGTGRLAELLTSRFGVTRIGADRALAMLHESRTADPLIQADATDLPLRDRSVDGVVVFRFLHHLDPPTARRVVDEAARVAREYVVVSFFHPVAVHGLTRRLRERISGRARTRFSLRHQRLAAWFAAAGYRPSGHAAELPYLRDFWLAAFRREWHSDHSDHSDREQISAANQRRIQ